METAVTLEILQTGNIEVEGLLPWSSNYTFLIRICKDDVELPAVYKPRRGERPLWDFPTGTLCNRERAAFLVSDLLGWHLIPPTVLRDGPNGIGSMQRFIENHDPERHYFTFEGDPQFCDPLQKLTLFDIVVNNADRKSGHVLLEEDPAGVAADRLWGIDHGICFHTEYKLRTVIWEFAGQPIPQPLLQDLRAFQDKLAADTNGRRQLSKLLSEAEVLAMAQRLALLIRQGVFPEPGPGRHYPWPPV